MNRYESGQEYVPPRRRRISPVSETVNDAVEKASRDNQAMRILAAAKLEDTTVTARVYLFNTCACACGQTSCAGGGS
jgi:uncharacterized pyridoxal phosphate-containing UPF0001 family protein